MPLRRRPRTLHGRPASADTTPPEPPFDPADRPSVQSIPPPTPVGDPPEELAQRLARSRAVTPDYARLSERRAASPRPEPMPAEPLEPSPSDSTPPSAQESAQEKDTANAPGLQHGVSSPESPGEAARPPTPPRGSPRERPRGFRMDAQAWWGLALLGAMIAIGFGGWLWTQGTYVPRPRAPAPATAAPQADTTPPAKTPPVSATVQAPSAPLAGSAPPRTDSAPAASPRKPAEVLADKPSRDDVRAVLTPLRDALRDCAHGKTGVAQLDMTVANTGAVTVVVVGGDFAGTREGSCIARVARTARFAPFKRPRFRVIFPFSL
jgi:hypothetical protein